MRSWAVAWQDALYGAEGLYRRPEGPGGHFETATHGPVGRALARTLLGLAREVGAEGVVDVGAGRGELLAAMRAVGYVGPLAGVDVVGRPGPLPADVGWVVAPGGGQPADAVAVESALGAGLGRTLVVAHEWLDVVPCTVAEVDEHGTLRVVEVDVEGSERLGAPLTGAELEWVRRWWPADEPGARVEVGLSRDQGWTELLESWRPGTAVAVDYAHTAEARPFAGTLASYRGGEVVLPVPDGSADITAHVAVDSLRHDEIVTGAEAVRRWGPATDLPDHALSRSDPTGYLAALADATAARTLAGSPFGQFAWVLARGKILG